MSDSTDNFNPGDRLHLVGGEHKGQRVRYTHASMTGRPEYCWVAPAGREEAHWIVRVDQLRSDSDGEQR